MCDIILLLLQLIQRRMRRMCLLHQSWTPGRRRFSGVISRLGGFKGHSCWFTFIHIYGQVGSYFFIMMAMTKTTIWNEDEKRSLGKILVGPIWSMMNLKGYCDWGQQRFELHCIQEYTRKNCTQEDRECANPFGELDQAAGGLQQEDDVPLHPAGENNSSRWNKEEENIQLVKI